MRKPRNRSDSSRLVSGTTSFAPGVLAETVIKTIVPPVPLNPLSVVVVSIDNRLGDFPPVSPNGTLSVFGGMAANGDIQIYLVNGAFAAPSTHPEIFVRYMVLPQ
jgi:hypothetical protein